MLTVDNFKVNYAISLSLSKIQWFHINEDTNQWRERASFYIEGFGADEVNILCQRELPIWCKLSPRIYCWMTEDFVETSPAPLARSLHDIARKQNPQKDDKLYAITPTEKGNRIDIFNQDHLTESFRFLGAFGFDIVGFGAYISHTPPLESHPYYSLKNHQEALDTLPKFDSARTNDPNKKLLDNKRIDNKKNLPTEQNKLSSLENQNHVTQEKTKKSSSTFTDTKEPSTNLSDKFAPLKAKSRSNKFKRIIQNNSQTTQLISLAIISILLIGVYSLWLKPTSSQSFETKPSIEQNISQNLSAPPTIGPQPIENVTEENSNQIVEFNNVSDQKDNISEVKPAENLVETENIGAHTAAMENISDLAPNTLSNEEFNIVIMDNLPNINRPSNIKNIAQKWFSVQPKIIVQDNLGVPIRPNTIDKIQNNFVLSQKQTNEPTETKIEKSDTPTNTAKNENDTAVEIYQEITPPKNISSPAKTATIANVLPMKDISLLGIIGPKSALNALMRNSRGRVYNVKVGDRVEGWRIIAISPDKVIIRSGAKTRTLTLPHS